MTKPTDFLKSKEEDKSISFIKKTLGGNKYIDFLKNKDLLDNLVDIYENYKNNKDDMDAFKVGLKVISKNIYMSMTFDKNFSESLSFNAPLEISIRDTMQKKAFVAVQGMNIKDVFGESVSSYGHGSKSVAIDDLDSFKSMVIDIAHENSPHYNLDRSIEASETFSLVLKEKGMKDETIEKLMKATIGDAKSIKKNSKILNTSHNI